MMIHQFYFILKKIEYKFMYMLGYVHPNIVIKTLQQIHEPPLYVNAKVYIKPNWKGLVKLANATKATESFLKLENEFNVKNLDIFEEIAENNWGNTMIQNLLNPNQIIDDKSQPIIISFGENFILKIIFW